MSDIHPKHEDARNAMATRLSRFFYDNRFGSDWVALAGDRFWTRVPATAGEKHTPSPETRHLVLEMLRDLEAAKAPRGVSLEEIEASKTAGEFDHVPPEAHERIWSRIDKAGPNGCWVWIGERGPGGYGRFEWDRASDRKRIMVHRYVYTLQVGPIPDGLEIDHLCRNRLCCNPAHLEAVTHRENVLRGTSPAARHAKATHCVKGHPLDGDNLALGRGGRRECRACHRERNAALRKRKASGDGGNSSRVTPSPVTPSDGPGPSPHAPTSQGPSDLSEARRPPVAGPLLRSPGRQAGSKLPVSTAASDDAAPASQGSLPGGRGGQASLPYQSHSETSRLAAHDPVTKDVAAAHRLLVLQTLRELGPLTDDQIADHLGLTTEQVRIRRIGLMHDRLVEQAGRGRSRKGRACNTWGLSQDAAVSA